MLNELIPILFAISTVFLAVQVLYLFFFSIIGHLKKAQPISSSSFLPKIHVFIPGYKEDMVIIDTVENALKQDYPAEKFQITVIADSFSPETLDVLRRLPIQVCEVQFEKSTKGKALHAAMQQTQKEHGDLLVILDADNHMAPGFLRGVAAANAAGFKVIQGHRVAKNTNTSFALLDACTEEINNHIFRRGHVAAGLPSALIGSGMAFDMALFEEVLEGIGDTTGEDKEIEFRIVRRRIPIAFLDNHYVLDEKVSNTAVFSKQRSRWLATQVEFFQKYFLESWVQLFRGNVAFFNKVFQTYLLPRVLLVLVLLIVLVAAIFFAKEFVGILTVLFGMLAFSLLIGIPAKWYNRRLLGAFMEIPGAIFGIFISIAGIKTAKKQFIHTPHGETH